MRAIKFFAASLMVLASSTFSFAQQVTIDTFNVNGNCGMCKSSIEKAAKLAGAQKAEWNKDTKELTVTYTTANTTTAKIQQKVALAGYDNEGFTATTASYDQLHSCCKYDRSALAARKDMDCCKDGKCSKEGHTGGNCCEKK